MAPCESGRHGRRFVRSGRGRLQSRRNTAMAAESSVMDAGVEVALADAIARVQPRRGDERQLCGEGDPRDQTGVIEKRGLHGRRIPQVFIPSLPPAAVARRSGVPRQARGAAGGTRLSRAVARPRPCRRACSARDAAGVRTGNRATPRGWCLSLGRVTPGCHGPGPPYATTGRVSGNCWRRR